MKLWKIMLIITGATLVFLAIFMIVPVIIMDKSWWWFFIPLIFFGVIYFFFGLGYLIFKIVTKKKPTEQKIDVKDLKLRAVHEMKYDPDNPDNFKIDKWTLARVGEKGADKTLVLALIGKGTEMNQKRVIIINTNNPKKESTSLIDPDDDEIIKAIVSIADHPPDSISEITTTSTDEFGRPTITKITKKPTSFEDKKKEEEKKAEESNAM